MRTMNLFLALWVSAGALLYAQDGLEIERNIHADQALKNVYIRVDRYGDLAVMHGWVADKTLRARAEYRVSQTPGINAVYNYMTWDQSGIDVNREINAGRRVQIGAANMNDRVLDTLGLPYVTSPSPLGTRVRQRLDGDVSTTALNVRVDTYGTLVLLHGNISDWNAARDAERVASATPGVERVYSYLTVAAAEEIGDAPYPVIVDLNPIVRPKLRAPIIVRNPDDESRVRNPNGRFR